MGRERQRVRERGGGGGEGRISLIFNRLFLDLSFPKTMSLQSGSENPQPENYLRLDSSNFPGQFDYQCSDSRVLWGCVMTFDSLEAAMDRCSTDVGCQSFVVFSSQPENESEFSCDLDMGRVNVG